MSTCGTPRNGGHTTTVCHHCGVVTSGSKSIWLHKHSCWITPVQAKYKSGEIVELERDAESKDFACVGCEYRTIFTGSMEVRFAFDDHARYALIEKKPPLWQFHALGCKIKDLPIPSEVSTAREASSLRQAGSVATQAKRKVPPAESSAQASERPSKRRETFHGVFLPRTTKVTQTAASRPSEPRQSTSRDRNEPLPQLQPRLPDSDVLAFASALPAIFLNDPDNFNLFVALGRAGIRTLHDLELLCSDQKQVTNPLQDQDISYAQWVIIRHSLQARSRGKASARNDEEEGEVSAEMQRFLKRRKLEYLSSIVGLVGFSSLDLKRIARDHQSWPILGKYLLSQDASFTDCLSLKRGLLALRKTMDVEAIVPSYHPLEEFLNDHVEGVSNKDSVKAALIRIGIDSDDDLDMLGATSEEQVDVVLDMLTQEGVRWLECKAIREGLLKRVEGMEAA